MFKYIWRIIFWSLLLIFLAYFSWSVFGLGGRLVLVQDFSKSANRFFYKFNPDQRLRFDDNQLIMTGNPLYFYFLLSRDFADLQLTVDYQNNDPAVKVLEAGVLMNKQTWSYQLQPLQNKIIDELLNKWSVIKQGDVLLLQKQKKYSSLTDFLAKPPSAGEIGFYNYHLNKKFVQPDDADVLPYKPGQVWSSVVGDLYTNSTHLSFQTIDPGLLSVIEVGNQQINLKETYRQYSIDLGEGVKKIKLTKNGLMIAGNGYFANQEKNLIEPLAYKIDGFNQLPARINYVIARYQAPICDQEFNCRATANFFVKQAELQDNSLNFMLSAPQLYDGQNKEIKIKRLTMQLTSKSLWQKIKNWLKK